MNNKGNDLTAMKCTFDKRSVTFIISLIQLGTGKSLKTFIFSMLHLDIIFRDHKPKVSYFHFEKSKHLEAFNLSLCLCRVLKMASRWSKCWSNGSENITMSSK